MFHLIYRVLLTEESLMLVLDKRKFIYKFKFKIIQPFSHLNLVEFYS